MAVLNFPNSPTIGDTYDFPPFTYQWDGEKWISIIGEGGGSGGGGSMYVQETAPVGALPGSIWFNTTNVRTYILYEDADSTQWVESSPLGSNSSEFLPLTGGTLTGPLSILSQSTTAHTDIVTGGAGGNINFYGEDGSFAYQIIGASGDSDSENYFAIVDKLDGVDHVVFQHIRNTDECALLEPHSLSAQGSAGNSLARRDWVENFAPAKYAGTLIAQDWNTIVLPGNYNVQYGNAPGGATTVLNAPDITWCKSPYGVLIVAGDGTFLAQFYLPHADSGITYPAFRLSYGVVWMPWQYLSKLTSVPADEPTNLEDRVTQLEAAVAALTATKAKKGDK